MATVNDVVEAEIDFRHPYTPYQIQKDLMKAIYDCIENGKVGIFESPTGTGKSLSLLCGSLTWLRNHKRTLFCDVSTAGGPEDEPDWIREHARKNKKQELLRRRDDLDAKLEAIREKERRTRERAERDTPLHKRLKTDGDAPSRDEEAGFMLDDYDSDGTADQPTSSTSRDDLSAETKALLQRLGLSNTTTDDEVDQEDEDKILICSRTHSQLSQLVSELRRVSFPSAYPADIDQEPPEYHVEPVKQLSLGSRKNLCINKKVNWLDSTAHINEKCIELQDSKVPADMRCQYLPNKDNEALTLDFKHYSLSKVRDIEDLAQLGTKIGICPYYASRPAIAPAEVVMLPYPLLLQHSAREALSLSVKGQVVIIDEAHNLMDAILGIYTTEITLADLDMAKEQLISYLQKFRNRLAGKNRVYVTQTVRVLDALRTCLRDIKSPGDGLIDSSALAAGKGVDQINLHKLGRYLQESKLARKVQGYAQHETAMAQRSGKIPPNSASRNQHPVLNTFQSFLVALTNPAKEGRFFYSKGSDDSSTKLKYLLLDPSQHFQEIVTSARSVILCGGTMSPMSDYLTQLFPYLPPSRITTLSCSHVTPPANLYVTTISTGHAGTPFDFSFSNRTSPALLDSLGQALLALLPLVPDGTVLFFPSYSYLDTVMAAWRRTSLLSRIERLKPVFIDSRAAAANTEVILRDYAAAVASPSYPGRGALLLSVIGGKLSEGINFSDRLGRCVVVVGMPWPNPNGAEWRARMEYIEGRAAAAAASSASSASTSTAPETAAGQKRHVKGEASRDFAENVCMRAVNQAIGRAIRHRDDWAGIVLIDRRYGRAGVQGKLPGWIKGSLRRGGEGGRRRIEDVEREMGAFYRDKESKS